MTKSSKKTYAYYERDGAIFRGTHGSGFVKEVRGPGGWELYAGDRRKPVPFSDFLGTDKSDD